MRGRIRQPLALVAGIAASLILHATVLVPGVVSAMRASPERTRALEAVFEPDDVKRPDAHESETALGIDTNRPSSLTWIGYEEYEEHLAALAEMDQALVREAPGAAPSEPTPPITPPALPEIRTAIAEPAQPEAADEPVETPPIDPPMTASASLANDDASASPAPNFSDLLRLLGVEQWREAMAVRPPAPRPDEPADAQPVATDQPAPSEPRTPTALPVEPVPPQPESPPGIEPTPADVADKESDATSTIEVPYDQLKVGKPIAGEGLELKPRRPEFTDLTRLIASPRNPVAEIRFGRDGKPKLARLITTSGDSSVDNPLLSSLYRWRATGAQLETLEGDETLDIRIRIVLIGR